MLETYSKAIIFKQMPPPQAPTLFVELVQFQAGSDMVSSKHTTPSLSHRSGPSYSIQPPPYVHHSQTLPTMQHAPPPPGMSTFHASSSSAPPPPPWSRWAPMSTPTMPPSTQRRAPNGEGPRTNNTVQSTSRKRKHSEETHHPHHQSLEEEGRLNTSYPLKRHAGPSLNPTPLSTPPRPVQTLSPSLAMIVSPTNQAVHASPRVTQLPPLMRNGSSGSPLLPPVKSLMGEPPRGPPH